jgi:hypothetical protein
LFYLVSVQLIAYASDMGRRCVEDCATAEGCRAYCKRTLPLFVCVSSLSTLYGLLSAVTGVCQPEPHS